MNVVRLPRKAKSSTSRTTTCFDVGKLPPKAKSSTSCFDNMPVGKLPPKAQSSTSRTTSCFDTMPVGKLLPKAKSITSRTSTTRTTSCFDDSRSGSTSTTESFISNSIQPFQKPNKPLLMLTQQRKWDEITAILQRKDNNNYDCETWMRECFHRHSGQTALHLVLKHRPPRSLVSLLIAELHQCNPRNVAQSIADNFGSTPLHVAVYSGCDVRVIEKLLCGKHAPRDNPAAIPDTNGRYPLHWACSPQVLAVHSERTAFRIINLLAIAYPKAVYAKDNKGQTPTYMAEQAFTTKVALPKALLSAELLLLKENGGTLEDLRASWAVAPLPVVEPVKELSVSSLGWDEDTNGVIEEMPAPFAASDETSTYYNSSSSYVVRTKADRLTKSSSNSLSIRRKNSNPRARSRPQLKKSAINFRFI